MSNELTLQEQRDNIASALANQVLMIAALDGIANIVDSHSVSYLFQAVDFGNGDTEEVIRGPSGKVGKVVSFTVFNVTEVFTDDTFEARLDVGDGSDPDAYALSGDLGVTGVDLSASPAITAGTLGNVLPADTDVTLTFMAPTGGTPKGIADALIVINWT